MSTSSLYHKMTVLINDALIKTDNDPTGWRGRNPPGYSRTGTIFLPWWNGSCGPFHRGISIIKIQTRRGHGGSVREAKQM